MAKITCPRCGIVDRKHKCPYTPKQKYNPKYKTNNNRLDKKMYKTDKWQNLRDEVIRECNNICLYSYYVLGIIESVDCCHHILSIMSYPEKGYDIDNVIGLTEEVHKHIHFIYKHGNRERCYELLSMCKKQLIHNGLRLEDKGIFSSYVVGLYEKVTK